MAVAIPTSRDITRQSTRSGRISPNAPQSGIGQALAKAGGQVVEAAFDLNLLAQKNEAEIANKRGNDVSTQLTRFYDEEEKRYNDAREKGSESGIGFTRSFLEGYQQRANEFAKTNFEGLNEEDQTRYNNSLISNANTFYGKAYDYETKAKTAYYDRNTNGNLDQIRTRIRNNAAPFDQMRNEGIQAIDAADMPEPWKAARRAEWTADAAESRWRWEFSKDPKAAIAKVSGAPVGNVVDKIIGVESGGNATARNPNSSATGAGQFISSTWMNMIKKYRPDVAEGKSASEVLAMRNDPALSREMTTRYTQENAEYLKNQGIQQTDGNVYLAHFLGPGGAARVLKGDPSASVASIVGEGVVNANPFLKGMSVADIQAWSNKKMGGAGVVSGGVSEEYNDIPEDRRVALAAQGQNDYNQMVNQQRAAAKDSYSLLIATQPQNVSQSIILGDSSLDNGDKATLIGSLNTAMKDRGATDALIGAIAAGSVSVNPFNNDQTKVADKAYERMLGAAGSAQDQQVVTSDFISRTGYIPQPVQAEIRRGAASTNPGEVASAMEAASIFQKNAPVSFGSFDGSSGVSKNLDLFKTYTGTMGYSSEEAARKIIASNDPEQIRRRDAILKSVPVKKALEGTDADDVAAMFKGGFLSSSPSVGAGAEADNIKVGVNPESEAAIVADYRSVLEEALVDANGDQTAAKDIAKRRFQTIYGTTGYSPLASNIVVRYPPEKAYPAMPDGSHDYIREQLGEAMKAEGVEASAFYLQGDADTEKDIKAGKPARYQVFYEQDGKLQRFNLPFYADPDLAKTKIKEKQAETVREAEQRMLENRTNQQRQYPDGEGLGQVERFNNGELYRGIAREGSPMAKAQQAATEKRNAAAAKGREGRARDNAEQQDWENLSPEEQRARSQDAFLNNPGPFQKQGNR